MNRINLFFLIVILFTSIVFSQFEVPKRPAGAVADLSALLTKETKSKLSLYSADIYKRTGIVVVFASIENIHNDSPEKIAEDIYKKWGIGRKTGDKGILILTVLNNQQLAFHVGKGINDIIDNNSLINIKKYALSEYLDRGAWDDGILSIYSQFALKFADYQKVESFTFLAFNKNYNVSQNSKTESNSLILYIIFSIFTIAFLLVILIRKKNSVSNAVGLYESFTDLFRCSLKSEGFGTYKRWMLKKLDRSKF